jgi:uncharacterized repeat protein (TIGR03837 family)
MGVCWRLARQLVREYDRSVTLMVDDWQAAVAFVGRQDARALSQLDEQGVRICHWSGQVDWHATVSGAAVIVEAFGCTLPDAVIAQMAALSEPAKAEPCWINLEYLSAEPWIESYHCQSSLLTVNGGEDGRHGLTPVLLHKIFFFPGFTAASGGLLRERDLLAQHCNWQAGLPRNRAELLVELDICSRAQATGWCNDMLWLSLFAYPRQSGSLAMTSWFAALAEGTEPVLCLIPAGRVMEDVVDALGEARMPGIGEILRRGSLSVVIIPFLPLDDYDRLLSLCDLNLVRGEDSFVRAQWAARPMVWHAYPQPQDAHMDKLDAFLVRYGETAPSASGEDLLLQFNRFWNLDADCRKLWHDLRPQLPDLTVRARNWQQKLAALPDLASSLMQFYRNRP